MFDTTAIPTDTLAAHSQNALRYHHAPEFKGRNSARKTASAALAMAILTSELGDTTGSDRIEAAATLRKLGIRFAVRLSGDKLAVNSHEVILASDQNALWQLCDGNATFRPCIVDGKHSADDVFCFDRRTRRVETWRTTQMLSSAWKGVQVCYITIDEQRI